MVIGDVTQAAYLGPWLWKAAVEKAGSFDVDKIRKASPGIEFKDAPEGYVRIHDNHHLWSKTVIGRALCGWAVRRDLSDARTYRTEPIPERLTDASPCIAWGVFDFTEDTSMFSDYNFADLASIFVMQGFSGLSLFAVFVLMSLGLAIIFGQMGVINMAPWRVHDPGCLVSHG
ncbi:transporter substrate-binding protein [Klebsiella variicola subsp. variicola]|nr:transporter substrate-binding protein [Klebsiella variicola subsp. variicola]